MLLRGIIKVLKSIQVKSYNIASQLPTCCESGNNSLGLVSNISRDTRFTFFFKSSLLGEIIRVHKGINKSI